MAPGLEHVPTPTVVVDLEVLERNLATMAARAHDLGVTLRPHAKTHKCVNIARRQVDLGARGLSVATVGEAEVFADGGFEDVFVAYPLWVDSARRARVAALAERVRLRVGVDSTEAAEALGRAVGKGRIEVLVEVDSGARRSGVDPSAVGPVADTAARAGLSVVGAFTFPGHGYGPGLARAAADDESNALARAAEALETAGHSVTVLSGGSTPTAVLTNPGVVTEMRPGVYVFNDAQQVTLGTCTLDDVALSVSAMVTSVAATGRVVLDSGSKVLSSDRPQWMRSFGLVAELPGATIRSLSEHHAVVELDEETPAPPVGTRVRVIPNHVCPTVNLVDEFVVTDKGEVVDRWRIAARGKNA